VNCFQLAKGGQPIYAMWSDAGAQMLDFSAHLSGQVKVTTAGEDSLLDTAAVPLTAELLFIEPE